MAKLDSLPSLPPLSAPAAAPQLADASPALGGTMEFRDIVMGYESAETDAVAAKLDAALAAAPTDAARAAILSEVSRSVDDIRMALDEGGEALVRLMERIIRQSSRVAIPVHDAPVLPVQDKPPVPVYDINTPETSLSFDEKRETKDSFREREADTVKEIARLQKLIDDTGFSREQLASRMGFDQAALDAAAKEEDPVKRARKETEVYARVIAQDADVRDEIIKKNPEAYHALAREFPDIDFPGIPEKTKEFASATTKYEQELMRRVGANPDIPTTRAGNRVTFATSETNSDGYVKMTLDVSREPPTVLRHGPNGTLVPMNLEGNKSFDRAYGLMRAAETASTAIDRLTSLRDRMLGDIDKIATSLNLDRGDSDDKPLDMVDSLIERAEARFAQDRLGTPPRIGAMDSALTDALEGGDVAAMQDVEASVPEEAMRGAERLLGQLKSIRAELAKLEEELARQTAEKLRLDTAKTAADEEFARHMELAVRNAESNMKSLEDTGVGELGQEGLTILVRLLNQPNVMAVLPNSEAIDLSQPLSLKQRVYIAHGMELVFGDASGLYDGMGVLRPEVRQKTEALRDRLVERGVLDDTGDVRPFMLERVFEASLSAPVPTSR